MTAIEILRSASELPGSCYMELCPGPYTGQHWGQHSLFFHEHTFGVFEPTIVRHVPSYSNYGHWAMTEVAADAWERIIDDLYTLRTILPEMELEEFLCRVIYAYQPMQSRCEHDFQQVKNETAAVITELTEWLNQQLKTHSCISILGI